MKKLFAFIFFLFILTVSFRTAVSPEKERTYLVYINYPDYSVRANVLRENKKIDPKPARTYYWYSNNDIKKTDGGFDGRLLHGEYKSFYRDMNLKEQGSFVNGLKEGNWITWFHNGKIQERLHYKKGLLNGYYEHYNEDGKMIRKSDYRDGVLHGKTISYSNSVKDSTILYRNGEPKHKTEKEKKKTDTSQKNEQVKIKQVKDTAQKKSKSIPDQKKSKNLEKKKTVKDTAQTKRKTKISKPT